MNAKQQIISDISSIWENSFKDGYKELKKGKTFTPEDKQEFKDLGSKYAKAVVACDQKLMETYDTALFFFLAVEAREVKEELADRIKRGIAESLPLILKLATTALGVAL